MYRKRGVPIEYKGFFGRHRMTIAATTLLGTIVGAGILGIPYVIAQTGILYGFILIVLIGIMYLFLNLFLGEVVLRTKEQHQLAGYAGKYLGKWGKRIFTVSMLISLYGALTAYLIGEGATLHSIFKFGTPLLYTFLFFGITFVIAYKGVKATGKAELILISFLLFIIVLIGVLSFRDINSSYLTHMDITKFFVPYGVIVFAYLGLPAIPEMQEELGREKKKFKLAIILGSIAPIIIYLLFTFFIVGIVGLENFSILGPNERIATIALSMFSYPVLGILANVLAVLAMFTSFLTISIALIEMYHFDYHFSRNISLGLVFLFPLIVTVLNLATFITVLGLTGAIAGGLEAILVILMFWKAKKLGNRKPEYSIPKLKALGFFMVLLFLFGILYQFL
ncbi:hypothetical protein COV17_03970 [Candidatus Woesearchaeota archaeon CG10_big_fil_rev_8_21_14_0_10_36_11]|nr:MAG: hypothetical protein COV17_03970 [Candidatus Woesearchaeota archaeon CG10_big_fil_rev_8_21_14_0_10_36_11]